MLKLDRRVVNPTSLADICQEDPVVYTPIDMIEMLDMINEGNRTVGGLSMTAKGYGIVGFVRFLDCYYLNFITQRRLVSRVKSKPPLVPIVGFPVREASLGRYRCALSRRLIGLSRPLLQIVPQLPRRR